MKVDGLNGNIGSKNGRFQTKKNGLKSGRPKRTENRRSGVVVNGLE